MSVKKKRQVFICFDTNIFVHCALVSKNPALNPNYLRKIFQRMDDTDAKLLVPDIVQMELQKVLNRELSKMKEALSEIAKTVDDNQLLGWRTKKNLSDSIKKSKKTLQEEADAAYEEIYNRMEDSSKSTIVRFSEGNVLADAIALAAKGSYPAKKSEGYGLLQADCIIAASIRKFADENPGVEIYFCSDNTRDFARKDGEAGFVFNDDLASFLAGVHYCFKPKQLFETALAMSEKDEELEALDEEYKRIVESLGHADLRESIAKTLAVYELKSSPQIKDQLFKDTSVQQLLEDMLSSGIDRQAIVDRAALNLGLLSSGVLNLSDSSMYGNKYLDFLKSYERKKIGDEEGQKPFNGISDENAGKTSDDSPESDENRN